MTPEIKTQLMEQMTILQNLLQNGDSEAQKVAQEIITILNDYSFQDELTIFKQIVAYIQSYDFERAAELLPSATINYEEPN